MIDSNRLRHPLRSHNAAMHLSYDLFWLIEIGCRHLFHFNFQKQLAKLKDLHTKRKRKENNRVPKE